MKKIGCSVVVAWRVQMIEPSRRKEMRWVVKQTARLKVSQSRVWKMITVLLLMFFVETVRLLPLAHSKQSSPERSMAWCLISYWGVLLKTWWGSYRVSMTSHVSRYIEVDQQSRGLDDLKEEEILVTIGYSQECKKTPVKVLGDISSWIRRCLCIKQFSGCGWRTGTTTYVQSTSTVPEICYFTVSLEQEKPPFAQYPARVLAT